MIARIHGILILKTTSHVVIDAHGVGYRVFVPLTTFYELPETGQTVALNVHTHVKEDGIHLFGFHRAGERDLFQMMISVSGIGPRLAMNILSGIEARELVRAVSQGDLRRLIGIPGVGKKMAERLILELKDKILKLDQERTVPDRETETTDGGQIREDALSALINLGYREPVARKVLEKLSETFAEPPSLDALLKNALKELAG